MASGSETAGAKFKNFNAKMKTAISERKTAAQARTPKRRPVDNGPIPF